MCLLLVACATDDDGSQPPGGDRDPNKLGDVGSEWPGDHGGDTSGAPTPDELRARVAGCAMVAGGSYAKDSGGTANISLCRFPGAIVWTADLDVDCDGKQTTKCNPQTDPDFMPETAANDSHGNPLDAGALPFVVIPGVSTRFDYRAAGLSMGTVVAVLYQNRIVYGPLGDVGPVSIIGEASYATAEGLGINPNPSTGGASSGVTYIAFTGTTAKLDTIEDHDEAVATGVMLAEALLAAP
jgi:hypothetical protein